jgi:serine/threonine protein kinase
VLPHKARFQGPEAAPCDGRFQPAAEVLFRAFWLNVGTFQTWASPHNPVRGSHANAQLLCYVAYGPALCSKPLRLRAIRYQPGPAQMLSVALSPQLGDCCLCAFRTPDARAGAPGLGEHKKNLGTALLPLGERGHGTERLGGSGHGVPKEISLTNRFDREIKATKALNHASIARVVDYSLEEPAFYVSPHYGGTSLRSIAPLETLKAIDVFIAIGEATAYAHSKGVIHRDLKPDNIIYQSDGHIVIVDFGLCYFEDDERLTETREQVGSRFYIAPELEAGRALSVTPLVDSYSLGKLLYFLLSGRDLHRELYSGVNDIVGVRGDKQLDYLNEFIFPVSIEPDPAKRVDVHKLLERARLVRKLVNEHFYPGREGSKCRFCAVWGSMSKPH